MISSFEPYKFSFTTGGLFYREALKVAALYRELGDWQLINQIVRSQKANYARFGKALAKILGM